MGVCCRACDLGKRWFNLIWLIAIGIAFLTIGSRWRMSEAGSGRKGFSEAAIGDRLRNPSPTTGSPSINLRPESIFVVIPFACRIVVASCCPWFGRNPGGSPGTKKARLDGAAKSWRWDSNPRSSFERYPCEGNRV
jgi:hypothetical protein